jgi:internalin A
LRRAIAAQAARLPQIGELLSPRWVQVRAEIQKSTEPQISYEEFEAACHRYGLDEPQTKALASLLHDLGHIIYYAEDEGLRSIVVLQPEWLTKAIGYVLEDTPTRHAGGVLPHARLTEIWQHRQGSQSYPAKQHPYFLRLMEKFDVSYRLPDENASLVAQLVPFERPTLSWDGRTEAAGTRILSCVYRLQALRHEAWSQVLLTLA